MIYQGELGTRFTIVSKQALDGDLTMEFRAPSGAKIQKAASIGDVATTFKKKEFAAENIAFYVREADVFNELGVWLVRLVQSRNSATKVIKSPFLSFTVGE